MVNEDTEIEKKEENGVESMEEDEKKVEAVVKEGEKEEEKKKEVVVEEKASELDKMEVDKEDLKDDDKKEGEEGKEEEKGEVEEVKEEEKEEKEEGTEKEEEKKEEKEKEEEEAEDDDEEEKKDVDDEEKEEVEAVVGGSTKGKRSKKTGGDKKEAKEATEEEPISPTGFSSNRPVRERKSVERLVATVEKEPTREFLVGKGRGTALKDIPNVASKLSKKRNDETFKTLHLILFGRRGKAMQVKSNISQFSGFVWHENEEKQRLKIKEKLDKCVKEKLFEFCDVFDIPVVKITAKKEEIVTKLLDFLAAPAPHATSTVVLSEKEKSDTPKRKRVAEKTAQESGGTSAKHTSKKQRKSDVTPKALEKSESESDGEFKKDEDDESDRSVPEGSEDEVSEHSESKEKVSNSGEESEGEKQSLSSAKKVSPGQTKSKKVISGKKEAPVTSPKKSATAKLSKDTSEKSPVVFARKKKNEETGNKKPSALSKSSSKQNDSEDNSGKSGKGKDEAVKEAGAPSEQDLRKVIREVLTEVDLNKATFIDILKQLGEHFNLDLTPRKTDIKLMVKEELTKLNEEDDDNESDAEEETPKPKPARREAQQKTPKTPVLSAEKKDTGDSDGRCRRSDGKKWRCKKDVVSGQKYCEHHMHRGRIR